MIILWSRRLVATLETNSATSRCQTAFESILCSTVTSAMLLFVHTRR
jgi:hypothetical protein